MKSGRMDKAISTTASIILVVLIAGAAIVFAYSYVSLTTPKSTTTVCSGCFVSEPVVDVIIPSLITHSNANGADNAPLNLTRGEPTTISVGVFPTLPVNVTLQFMILSTPPNVTSDSIPIMGNFTPSKLTVNADSNGTSTLSIDVAPGSPVGAYSAEVTAIDFANSSWSWGTVFTINVR